MGVVDIKIEGESIDLFPNEERNFYLTKQIHDLINLETRDASFSKTIRIPLTTKNRFLLRSNMPNSSRHTDDPVTYLKAEVLIGGVVVIGDAYALISNESKNERTIGLAIVATTAVFFNALKDEPLNALNFTDLDFDWDLNGIAPYVGGGLNGAARTPIQVTQSSWYTNTAREEYISNGGDDTETNLNEVELGESGFVMFFKTLTDKIFGNMNNLTIDYGDLETLEDFNDSGIFIPVPIVHDSFGAVEGTYSEVQNNSYTVPVASESRMPFPIVINNPDGNWDSVNNIYEFNEDGFFTVKFYVEGTSFRTPQQFWIYKESIFGFDPPLLLGQAFFSYTGNEDMDLAIQTTVNVVAGDFIYVEASGDAIRQDETLITSSSFQIEKQGAGRGRALNVSSVLPEMTQKNFIKEIFKTFNVLVTESDRVVKFTLFKNVQNNNPITLEFNNRLDSTYSGAFITYGSNNNFIYPNNSEVLRQDQNFSWPILDITIQESVDKIVSKFDATDTSVVTGMVDSTSVPNYSLDYSYIDDNLMTISGGTKNFSCADRTQLKAGDLIAVEQQGVFYKRRIISMIDDFSGLVDVDWLSNKNGSEFFYWRYEKQDVGNHIVKVIFNDETNLSIQDGGNSQIYPYYAKAQFTELRWSNLSNKYYTLLIESFFKPFRVTGWMNLSLTQYLSIDGTQPIYIESLDAYFYMNKIEQWRYNGSTRVELIKLNASIVGESQKIVELIDSDQDALIDSDNEILIG